MRVKNLTIREIFATNSQKTIEVELETANGTVRSSVPIGTSTGKYEVRYLPTDDVIRKFLIIRRYFTRKDFTDQKDVDATLRLIDKSVDFRDIGGNLALAISSVFLKGFALEQKKEVFEFLLKEKPKMPLPLCNMVGGWKRQSDIQEFLLLSVHQKTFLDSVTKLADAYGEISEMLKEMDKGFNYEKNLESAWVTKLYFGEMLKIMSQIAKKNMLKIGLDVAASQLWDGNYYVYPRAGDRLTRPEQIGLMEDLIKKYPIVYVEDPFHEDDFPAFSTLMCRLPNRLISGDDLYATNLNRLKTGIEQKATNTIIIKPNQVGTITDVMRVVEEAKKANMKTVMSHRSGETEDTLICHLAVGLGCDYIKLGISGERTVKINEMIRIEERLK